MKSDGYADHTATEGAVYEGEVWPEGGGWRRWNWSLSVTRYNQETAEVEASVVDEGWEETEADAQAALDAAREDATKRGD